MRSGPILRDGPGLRLGLRGGMRFGNGMVLLLRLRPLLVLRYGLRGWVHRCRVRLVVGPVLRDRLDARLALLLLRPSIGLVGLLRYRSNVRLILLWHRTNVGLVLLIGLAGLLLIAM